MFKRIFLIFFLAIYAQQIQSETVNIIDIYVDGQTTTDSPDGSHTNPYTNIIDGLKRMPYPLNPSQINIYIAPTSNPYGFGDLEFSFDGKMLMNLTLTTWPNFPLRENQEEKPKIASINFELATLHFESINLLNISNMKFIGQKGMISIQKSNVVIEYMVFNEPFGLNKESLINMTECMNIKVFNISVSLLRYAPLMSFNEDGDGKTNQNVHLENITVNAVVVKMDDFAMTIYGSIFHFGGRSLTVQKRLLIRNFRVNSIFTPKESYMFPNLGPILSIDSWTTVSIYDFIIEDGGFKRLGSYFPFAFNIISNLYIDGMQLIGTVISPMVDVPLMNFKTIDDLTLVNTKFIGNSISAAAAMNGIFVFSKMSFVKKISFINSTINNNVFSLFTELFTVIDYRPTDTKSFNLDMSVENLTISNNTNQISNNNILMFLVQGSYLQNFKVHKVDFTKNALSGRIFSLQNRPPTTEVENGKPNPPKEITFSKINVYDNIDAYDTNFLHFFPLDDSLSTFDCLQLVEFYIIKFDELKVRNNRFMKGYSNLWTYEVHFIQVKETQVFIENSLIKNNSFVTFNFLTLDERPSTVIFTNNQVHSNVFSAGSLLNSDYLTLDNPCSAIRNSLSLPTTLLHRYSFVLNSNFTHNDFFHGTLFELDNGFFVIHNNNFAKLSFTESHFVKSSYSSITLPAHAEVYTENQLLKFLTLGTYLPTWKIFNETLAVGRTLGNPEMCFFSMYGNMLTNMTISHDQFIFLQGFGNKQSFIRVENNEFLKFEVRTVFPSLFLTNNVEKFALQNNVFQNIEGRMTLFSLLQCTRTEVISVISNKFFNVNMAAFFSYKGDQLNWVQFKSNIFIQTGYSLSCLSLVAKACGNSWFISDNVLSGVLFYPSSGLEQERFGMIYLSIQNKQIGSMIFASNNVFDNINFDHITKNGITGKVNLFSVESHAEIRIYDTVIQDVRMSLIGSLMYLPSSSSLTIQDTIFTRISFTSTDGLIYSKSNQTLLSKTTFSNITNHEKSGMISISPSVNKYSVQVKNCSFLDLKSSVMTHAPFSLILNIKPYITTLIYYKDPNLLTFEFSDNIISSLTNGAALYFTSIKCADCVIKNSIFLEEGQYNRNLIQMNDAVEGKMTIYDVTLPLPAFCLERYAFLLILNSDIEVDINEVHQKGNDEQLNLAILDSGSLVVQNTNFQELSLAQDSFISVIPNKKLNENGPPSIFLRNCTFKKYNALTLVGGLEEEFVRVFTSQYIEHKKRPIIALVYTAVPIVLSIQDCIFEDITRMPVIFMENYEELKYPGLKSSIKLRNSTFKGLSHISGPAITIVSNKYNTHVDIKNCTFENNAAYAGGALAIYDSYVNIEDSSFINNQAKIAGASIFTNSDQYDLEKNISNSNLFSNNKALYKEEIGADATDFTAIFIADDYKSSGIVSHATVEDDVWSLTLLNVSSLELQKGVFLVRFLDRHKNIAPHLSTELKATVEVPRFSDDKTTDKFVAGIYRETNDYIFVNISLKEVTFVAKANETIPLRLAISSPLMTKEQVISLVIRPCLPGEFNDTSVCQPCPLNTYSLQPTQACTACPANAKCPNQSKIIPIPGYWNVNTSSFTIIECRNDDIPRCNHSIPERKCIPGYTGPLCNACDFDNEYVETGYLKCGLCQNTAQSLIYSLVLGGLYVLYQLFCINAIYEGNKKTQRGGTEYLKLRQREKSYYIKSLLTYTQLMSILYLSNPAIYKSLGLASQIGNPVALIIYGTQCTMRALGLDHKMFVFYQTLLAISTPLAQLILVSAIVIILKTLKPRIHAGKIVTVALFYYIISYQPGITTNLALFLSCRTQDSLGYEYISSHPYWQCTGENYDFYSNYVAIPNLVLWCVLVPLIILVILIINKHNLRAESIRTPLGVMYIDLKEKYYYWGVVLMLLKIMLSLLAYGLEQGGEALIFVSLLLLWLYQGFVRALKPYKTESFNNFEKTLINLLMYNIVVSRYLLDTERGNLISKIALVITIIFNLGFVVLVTWKILSLTVIKILAFVEKDIMQRRITRRIRPSEQAWKEQNAML